MGGVWHDHDLGRPLERRSAVPAAFVPAGTDRCAAVRAPWSCSSKGGRGSDGPKGQRRESVLVDPQHLAGPAGRDRPLFGGPRVHPVAAERTPRAALRFGRSTSGIPGRPQVDRCPRRQGLTKDGNPDHRAATAIAQVAAVALHLAGKKRRSTAGTDQVRRRHEDRLGIRRPTLRGQGDRKGPSLNPDKAMPR